MKIIYENSLASPLSVQDFIMEGPGAVSFASGRMRLHSTMDPGADDDTAANQRANLVYWCPKVFPDNIQISWEFSPQLEPGLAILFFSAVGRDSLDLFDAHLAPRSGPYDQYHHGDIHALHVSYFRRRYQADRAHHVCNLRKSYGFHLVAQGADPIVPVSEYAGAYQMVVEKRGPQVRFLIGCLELGWPVREIFSWSDGGTDHGPLLGSGRVGFRQMAPLVAEYANLCVKALP